MSALKKNLQFFIGTTIGNSPFLFPINYYRKEYNDKIVQPDSDCCIEGFQRSGNSFFTIQFRQSNRKAKVAHHTHAAAQIIKAVKYKIPTIVHIRKPEDAIASLIAWDTSLKSETALKAYSSFHKKLIPYVDQLLVIAFEDVISKPVDVVKALNNQFDSNFGLPEFSDQKLNDLRKKINSRYAATVSPLPSPIKDQIKEKVKNQIVNDNRFVDAMNVYKELYKLRHKFE